MPSSTSTITSADVNVGGISSSTSSEPKLSSPASTLSKVDSPSFTSSTLSVDVRSVRDIYAGPSFHGRINYIDATLTPIPQGELDVIAGATISEISGPITMYVGLFEDRTEGQVSLPLPSGTVLGLYVESTEDATSSSDFTFEVMKNGTGTGMSVSIASGENDASVVTPQPTFSTGDTFSVKLVAGSDAPSAKLKYSIKYNLN